MFPKFQIPTRRCHWCLKRYTHYSKIPFLVQTLSKKGEKNSKIKQKIKRKMGKIEKSGKNKKKGKNRKRGKRGKKGKKKFKNTTN